MTYIVEAKVGVVSGFSHTVDMNPNIEMNENSNTGTWKNYSTVIFASIAHWKLSLLAVCQRKLFPGIDITTGDIMMVPAASAEHCHALCTAHPKCTFFSFNRLVKCMSPNHD